MDKPVLSISQTATIYVYCQICGDPLRVEVLQKDETFYLYIEPCDHCIGLAESNAADNAHIEHELMS